MSLSLEPISLSEIMVWQVFLSSFVTFGSKCTPETHCYIFLYSAKTFIAGTN